MVVRVKAPLEVRSCAAQGGQTRWDSAAVWLGSVGLRWE
jgi:hypothetical protein